MIRPTLVLSHGALLALGAWLAVRGQQNPPPAQATIPMTAPPSVSSPPTGKPAMATKVALASPAAWRAAWEQGLLRPRSGRDGPQMPDSIGFFMDWCEVDPDGAIRGLAKTYAPHFAHNFLGNAVQKHGAALAPALVKHYRELRFMADYKVEGYLGRALNSLAKEDAAQAATLLASVAPAVRSEVYRGVFEQLGREDLDRLYTSMPANVSPEEARRRNEAYASAVDVANPESGVWNGLAEAGDPALRKAFAAEGFRKAVKAENWSGFFDAVGRLEPTAREEVRQAIQSQLSSGGLQEKARASISEECRRAGLDDWSLRRP